jgi:hypothetical protein
MEINTNPMEEPIPETRIIRLSRFDMHTAFAEFLLKRGLRFVECQIYSDPDTEQHSGEMYMHVTVLGYPSGLPFQEVSELIE